MFKKRFLRFLNQFKDENFLGMIHWVENCVSKILSVALILVIIVSLVDLIRVLLTDLFTSKPTGFFDATLIEIFGLFLNILIALELLENITAYLKKHIVQVELVVVTALIAVSRKIIIFDTNKYQKIDVVALAGASLALAASYWLIRIMNEDIAIKNKRFNKSRKSRPDDEEDQEHD